MTDLPESAPLSLQRTETLCDEYYLGVVQEHQKDGRTTALVVCSSLLKACKLCQDLIPTCVSSGKLGCWQACECRPGGKIGRRSRGSICGHLFQLPPFHRSLHRQPSPAGNPGSTTAGQPPLPPPAEHLAADSCCGSFCGSCRRTPPRSRPQAKPCRPHSSHDSSLSAGD